jgi:hypothetical protein
VFALCAGRERAAAPQLHAGLRDAEAGVAALPASAWGPTRSPEKSASIRPFSSALQHPGTMRSFVGDTEGAIAAFDVVDRTRSPQPPASPEGDFRFAVED